MPALVFPTAPQKYIEKIKRTGETQTDSRHTDISRRVFLCTFESISKYDFIYISLEKRMFAHYELYIGFVPFNC